MNYYCSNCHSSVNEFDEECNYCKSILSNDFMDIIDQPNFISENDTPVLEIVHKNYYNLKYYCEYCNSEVELFDEECNYCKSFFDITEIALVVYEAKTLIISMENNPAVLYTGAESESSPSAIISSYYTPTNNERDGVIYSKNDNYKFICTASTVNNLFFQLSNIFKEKT